MELNGDKDVVFSVLEMSNEPEDMPPMNCFSLDFSRHSDVKLTVELVKHGVKRIIRYGRGSLRCSR